VKGIKQSVLGFVALGLAVVCGTAAAAEARTFGWYLEGNLGHSSSHKTFPGTVKNTGLGGSLAGGYKFTQYVAVDVGLTQYAQARIQNSAGTTAATDQHFSYDIAAKFMLPIMKTGLDLFARAGVDRMHSQVDLVNQGAANRDGLLFNTGIHSHNGIYYGAGAEYAVLSALFVNAQWMRATGSYTTGRADLYSGGLSYIF
jgi:opacity protein-like surface antigen